MSTHINTPSASFLFKAYLLAVAAGVLVMVAVHAYESGFSGADEPSHFLNGYFVANYLSHHFGSNPMAAATEFYIHYPKISIGHWPPAYYGFLGLLFLVLPASIPVAFAINVVVSALPAIGVATALSMLGNRRLALAGVSVYVLAPLVIEGQAMFMVDQPLSACLAAATAIWIGYTNRPTWGRAIGFALLAALAVLIKGNGWLVVFIPVYHILLRGDWKQLLSIKLYVAAALAAMLVVPWYLLTAKIAADGFNYHAGLPYAAKALVANLLTLVNNLTPVGVLLALYACVAEFRERRAALPRWTIVSGLISLIMATLTLQSIVPVDIVDRYMAPAIPAMVVLALLGIQRLLMLSALHGANARRVLPVVLLLCMVAPGVRHLIQREPKANTGVAQISREIAGGGRASVTVIDGPVSAEGAFIALMAIDDTGLKSYVVRASKLLADSNFMGSNYALKFQTPQEVLDELHRLGVQHVVVVRALDLPAFPHSKLVLSALQRGDSGFHLKQQIKHAYRRGVTEIYDATGTVTPNFAGVRELGLPAKAINIVTLK